MLTIYLYLIIEQVNSSNYLEHLISYEKEMDSDNNI
jgi:hypothetical protein